MGRGEITVGVLALQGAFQLHQKHVRLAHAGYQEVGSAEDFHRIDGLIIPGGESGVMSKLLDSLAMVEALTRFVRERPVWGICAGAILLAKNVTNPVQASLGAIDVDIRRNGYGRQSDSFEDVVSEYRVAYIRAPLITGVGKDVEVLHRCEMNPTWIKSKNVMITTFHPEINPGAPSPWHRVFIEMIRQAHSVFCRD